MARRYSPSARALSAGPRKTSKEGSPWRAPPVAAADERARTEAKRIAEAEAKEAAAAAREKEADAAMAKAKAMLAAAEKAQAEAEATAKREACLLYTSPSPRDGLLSRMPSSA